MARDDVATTEAKIVVLAIRRYVNHPAVLAAGLHQPLCALVDYIACTEGRIDSLERQCKELRERAHG
ncbi:MAG: hypothetical protein E6R03_06375 [Hyphomicrobiaceae bacterium]|nr:MAG: hypothetical protein E6R03_06375 [Hyphomicrobiaceae bacterium]